MGPVKYEDVGKSQPVLMMINPIIFTRTRMTVCPDAPVIVQADARLGGGSGRGRERGGGYTHVPRGRRQGPGREAPTRCCLACLAEGEEGGAQQLTDICPALEIVTGPTTAHLAVDVASWTRRRRTSVCWGADMLPVHGHLGRGVGGCQSVCSLVMKWFRSRRRPTDPCLTHTAGSGRTMVSMVSRVTTRPSASLPTLCVRCTPPPHLSPRSPMDALLDCGDPSRLLLLLLQSATGFNACQKASSTNAPTTVFPSNSRPWSSL
jgi:hypothetical protein